MPSETLHDLTADLRSLGGGRVWSLMVSLFGDLAQGKAEHLEGPVLSAIMTALDVRPEAVRVALHRLRNDGWLTSAKRGRISQHSLTAKGRRESAEASPRIYAAPEDGRADWQLVVLPESSAQSQKAITAKGWTLLLPRVFVGPAGAKTPADALCLPGDTVPDWVRDQITPVALVADYANLHSALATLSEKLPPNGELGALDTAVLRCLVVHNWRRLVLKHPAPPGALVDPDSAMHRCHVIVHDLLTRYARPSIDDITAEQKG